MAGIDTDRIVGPDKKYIEGVKCPLCYNIMDRSVVTKCAHAFCSLCLQQWIQRTNSNLNNPNKPGYKRCPTCRGGISPDKRPNDVLQEDNSIVFEVNRRKYVFSRNLSVDDMISKLEITCDFAIYGCRQTMELGQLARHRDQCEHRICPVCETPATIPPEEHNCLEILKTQRNEWKEKFDTSIANINRLNGDNEKLSEERNKWMNTCEKLKTENQKYAEQSALRHRKTKEKCRVQEMAYNTCVNKLNESIAAENDLKSKLASLETKVKTLETTNQSLLSSLSDLNNKNHRDNVALEEWKTKFEELLDTNQSLRNENEELKESLENKCKEREGKTSEATSDANDGNDWKSKYEELDIKYNAQIQQCVQQIQALTKRNKSLEASYAYLKNNQNYESQEEIVKCIIEDPKVNDHLIGVYNQKIWTKGPKRNNPDCTMKHSSEEFKELSFSFIVDLGLRQQIVDHCRQTFELFNAVTQEFNGPKRFYGHCVMIPEAIIKAISIVRQCDWNESEEIYRKGNQNKM